MNRHRIANVAPQVCAALLAVGLTSAVRAAPPKVIKATPDNGATDVDPNLREIRIEFDQDMDQGGLSLCGGGDTFPELRGRPRWDSPRICAAAVSLKPEHEYNFSVNCPAAQNFRSKGGEAAEIYPITFHTGKPHGGTDIRNVTAKENKASVAALRRAIDQDYAYRDVHKVDWDKAFAEAGPRLEQAETTGEFVKLAADLLAKAQDLHITLEVADTKYATAKRAISPNCNAKSLKNQVPKWKKLNKRIVSGRFDDGIGYILIASWDREDAEALEAAFEALESLADAKSLIIDVRLNAGGDEGLAQKFAGCFVDKPVVYAKNVYRSAEAPGGFTAPMDRVLEPTKARPKYRGKVAVLMGPYNMSSCEGFLLMMRQVPDCKLVGASSYGSSGNPQGHGLPNGVTVYLPSWKDMAADGTVFEGVGIKPDVSIKADEKDFENNDPVLQAALKLLRGRLPSVLQESLRSPRPAPAQRRGRPAGCEPELPSEEVSPHATDFAYGQRAARSMTQSRDRSARRAMSALPCRVDRPPAMPSRPRPTT